MEDGDSELEQSPPPVPPPCSSSVPLNVLHNVISPSGLHTTDAESIQTCL